MVVKSDIVYPNKVIFFIKKKIFLYSANFEGSIIYNIFKTLILILESYFNYGNEYRFMLNNNFELMANSILKTNIIWIKNY